MSNLVVHAQLIRDSALRPRAAVKLALQHPDTSSLAWAYVWLASAAAVIAELVSSVIVAPADQNEAASPFDTPAFNVIFNIAANVVVFYVLRWYLRRFAAPADSDHRIMAALTVVFALSVAMCLPQYMLMDWAEDKAGGVQLLSFLGPILLSIILSAIAFEEALKLTFEVALRHSMLSMALSFAVVAAILIPTFLTWEALGLNE
jgi:hypothetical protein